MKRQYINQAYEQEINFLSDQLDPRDMFVLGYLKGFNRRTMKEWSEKGLWDVSVEID
jgi:hypothetical protein